MDTARLCQIADAGPLVHTMDWEFIGKTCGDASLRIASLEACIRQMHRAVPGGAVCDPQRVADEMREIASRCGVEIAD